MPKKFVKKISGAWAWAPGLIAGYSIYAYANWKEAQIKIDHRL
jgi:hypothetical protein